MCMYMSETNEKKKKKSPYNLFSTSRFVKPKKKNFHKSFAYKLKKIPKKKTDSLLVIRVSCKLQPDSRIKYQSYDYSLICIHFNMS